MWEFALKSVKRQKSRTILTTLGIIIGIAAIVSISSFAEGINTYFQGALEFSAGKVLVQQVGSGGFSAGFSGSDITDEQVQNILELDGVDDVAPVNMYFEGSGFGPELVVAGIEPGKGEYFTGSNIKMYSGRGFEETSGESDVMVIGKDLAEKKSWNIGDFVRVKNTDFEIVGIIEKLNNANIDGSAIVHIEDLQSVLGVDTYQMVYVIPEDVRQVESIADNIVNMDDTLSSSTSKDIARQSAQVINQIRLFTFGLGAIAAVVGGLGVLNTMIMAVMERRKEIGVMKAIGATRMKIIIQIITESCFMSVIGGAAGILLGILGSAGLRVATGGGVPAVVTPGLALIAMLFALALGLVGGAYPAIKASRLDPVDTLRYE